MRAIRIISYVVLLGALLFVPLNRIEIADLEPIQAVWMHTENGNIVLEADTEDKGAGNTVETALEDMRNKSTGVVYLDTAQYLFVSESALGEIPAIQPYFKGSIRLCKWNGEGGLKEVAKYADSRNLGQKIKKWNEAGNLPEIPPVKKGK